ncbi:polymorphic toxin-type HINT domain-containing protein [Streptomyces sp. NPDC048242]|uniref:polymorphic toxin-type HINT domain-containing protein n=1 Tax=Streptomyces sp. NPDC048242 TaxID=3155026 RepID=UPI00342D8B70
MTVRARAGTGRPWRRVAVITATVLTAALLQASELPAVAQGWHKPALPKAQSPVAVVPLSKPLPRKVMKGPRTPAKAPATAWPKAGTAAVTLGQGATRVKGLPLTLDTRVGKAKDAADGTYTVGMLSRAAARKAGVDGPLFTLTPRQGALRHDGKVRAGLDYSSFAGLYGGDYASRLTLVRLPACALTTPEVKKCRTTEPVKTVNDTEKRTLTASSVALGASGATVLAATTSAAGDRGDYKATSLSSSSTWNIDSNSGSFGWSYDMPVPQVPGGLAPQVALSYSSGGVDGRTGNSNNQASWAGDGFDLSPGFIERSYKGCSDDGVTNADGNKPGDLCWAYDNASLSLNGSGGELVPNGTNSFKLKNDDGTKVDRIYGSASDVRSNGARNDEYWRVTTPDGTQYFFGYNRLPGWASGNEATDSTWTVPVFGNNAGEPCNASTFAASWCQQGWRWNLDYVVDPHGNAIAYYYDKETNSYGRNLTAADDTPYVRGGTLDRVEYGLKSTAMYSAKALAKVNFISGERCIPDSQTTCSSITTGSQYWYDTPWDLNCDAGTDCDKGRVSPAFFTRKRLTDVTSQVLVSGSYSNVDSWKLTHRWGMADTDYQLLLDSIQHTGYDTAASIQLPKVTFAYTQLPNRLDKTGDGYAPYIKSRLSTVSDESGGQVDVGYSAPVCDAASLPTPQTNTTRCFPQYIGGSTTEAPDLQWFNKYVADSVTSTDRTGGAPDRVATYEYLDGAAWHYDDDDGLTKEKSKTWSQWRGYGHVRVRTGGQGGAPAMRTQTDTYFLRGMDGDRKNTDGGIKSVSVALDSGEGDPITDLKSQAGYAYKTVTYSAPGGNVLSKTVSRPWYHQTAQKVRDWGTVTANFSGTASTKAWTSLDDGAGVKWRTTAQTNTFDDATGLVTQTEDLGDTATAADDQCTRTTYAPDGAVLGAPARVETVAKACDATTSRPADVVSDVRTAYDGLAYGAAAVKGDLTRMAKLKTYNGTTAAYLESGTTYDGYGRPLTTTDLTADVTVTSAGTLTRTARTDGRTSTTAYTPTSGFPTSSTATTPPATVGDSTTAQTTTTAYEALRGLPLTVSDTNSKVTTYAYDALGRTTKVWQADRTTGQTPSYQFGYTVAENQPVVVTTKTIGNNGAQDTAYTFYDGFLRPRQTQTPGPNGGTLLADTFYDERGLTAKEFAPYYITAAPSATLLKPQDALSVETQSRYTYDGLGRMTESRKTAGNGDGGAVLSTTRTIYGGDRTTVIPPAGATATTSLVDARGHTTELRQLRARAADAAYDSTTYGYSPHGELTKVTDPAGNVWTWKYDLLGRLTDTTDPDKGAGHLEYDDRSQLTTSKDGRNSVLAHVYDGLGRRTELHDGSPTGTLRAKWVYDTISGAKGQLASSSRFSGGQEYKSSVVAYDRLYRPLRTSVVIPASEGTGLQGTYLSATTYNDSGTVAGVGYPKAGDLAADTVTYTYEDGTLRPVKVSGPLNLTATTAYSLTGQPLQYSLTANGGKSTFETNTYQYGTQRLATSRVDRQDVAGVDQYNTYSYDEAGNVLSVSDTSRSGTDNQCFTYDYLARMTEAWSQPNTGCATDPATGVLGGPAPYWNSYTYDKVGNRLTETQHGTTAGAPDTRRDYHYPDSGPSAVRPHGLGTVDTTSASGKSADTFTYDDAGNTRTRLLANGSSQTLDWDAEGHLAKVTEPVAGGSDKVTEYLYDADGNRLIGRTPTETTLYLGATEITLAKNATTAKGTRYIDVGGGHQAVQANDGSISFTLADHHGTAQLSVNATTQAETQRRTMPFGGLRGTKPATWTGTKGFVGGTDDTSTGLTHLGAREYDAANGRFLSVDPLMTTADPQTLNAYAYANNSPVTSSDPSGLCMADQCGIGYPIGGTGSNGHPKEYVKKAPRGAGGVGVPGYSGAGYTGKLPTAAHGDSNNMVKSEKDGKWYVRIYPAVYMEADNPHVNEVAANFSKWAAYVCDPFNHGNSHDCMAPREDGSDPEVYQRVKGKMLACESDWDCGADWFNPVDLVTAGAESGLIAGNGRVVGRLGQRGGGRSGSGEAPTGGRGCSFDPDTPVLMADGTTKPIGKVEPGDHVESADPGNGKHQGSREVTSWLVNHDNDLVDVRFKDSDGKTQTLHTTSRHPFWDDTTHAWVPAGKLTPGHALNTSADKHVRVIAVKLRPGAADMYNLTVSELHTYYVLAGETPVLVHNSNGCRTFGSHSPTGRLNVPDTQGVYIIKMKDGKVYVGSATKTNTIHRRVHRAFSDDRHAVKGSGYKSSDVRELDWIELPGEDESLIYQHEQNLIDYYGGIGGGTLLNRINAPAP